MLMVGYEPRDFTYRLFDPRKKTILVSREVHFDESPGAKLDLSNDAESEQPFTDFADFMSDSCDTEDSQEQHALSDDETIVSRAPSDAEQQDDADHMDQSGGSDMDISYEAPAVGDRSTYLDAEEAEGPLAIEAPPQAEPGSSGCRYPIRSRGQYNDLAEGLAATTEEPTTVAQALNSPDADKWKQAMQSEFDSLIANQTWVLVKLPAGRRPITAKWIFKIKYKADGSLEKFKARLVARGFTQKPGIDYQEIYSPVVRLESVRILLALAAQFSLKMINFDVKTAYLHGTVQEELYMNQPEGFVQPGGLVCKLQKALYGLKQAGRCWNVCFTEFLEKFDLVPLRTDHCIFRNRECKLDDSETSSIIIALYVDDGLIFSNCESLLADVLKYLRSRFEITVGDATSYVGLQIERLGSTIQVHQSHYIARKAELLGLDEPKLVTTPLHVTTRYCKSGTVGGKEEDSIDVPYRQLIGTLMYAANGTRPDIAYAVCSLSRFNEDPKESHWLAATRTMRYLAQSTDRRITYTRNEDGLEIVCYSDADHGGDRDDRKSVSGILMLCNGAPILWRSAKQSKIANSTAVAEFIAAAQATREVIWLRNILGELGVKQSEPTPLKVDNQTAIALISNNQVHAKTKALDIDLLSVRDEHGKAIKVGYVPSEEQLADYLTKPLNPTQFNKLLDSSGLQKRKPRKNKGLPNMAALLTVGLVLMTMVPIDAKIYRQPYETVIRIDQQCYLFKGNSAWNAYEGDRCMQMWGQTQNLLARLPQCMNNRHLLGKRSTPDTLETLAPKITWASAFNFLLQQGEKVVSGSPLEIAYKTFRVIGEIAYKKFVVDAHERTVGELEADTKSVSETAASHTNETRLAIGSTVHTLESLRRRYMDEVVGANAMIMALHNTCERGHVDTLVLAELSGQHELRQINPESTSIVSMNYDAATNQLSVVFDAIIDEPWTHGVNWTFWLVAFAMLVLVGIFGAIAYYFTQQMNRVRDDVARTYQETRQASIDEFTLRRSHYRANAAYASVRSFVGAPPAPPPLLPEQDSAIEMTALVTDDTSPSGGVVSGAVGKVAATEEGGLTANGCNPSSSSLVASALLPSNKQVTRKPYAM